MDDGKHLLVVDHVVAFDRREGFGEEHDGVPFLVGRRDLGQDGAGCEVRAIGLNAEGFSGIGRDKNRGRGDAALKADCSSAPQCHFSSFLVRSNRGRACWEKSWMKWQ